MSDYDPTNIDNKFLSKELVMKVAQKIGGYANSNCDALSIIISYENKRRDEIKQYSTTNMSDEWLNQQNFKYRQSHGDWVHHSGTYEYFYKLVTLYLKEGL